MSNILSERGGSVPIFTMIDLFAGIGGLSLGLSLASHDRGCIHPRLMVDNDPEARMAAIRNFTGTRYLAADVHKLRGSEIRDAAGLGRKDDLHLLVGGPPCQGFSWLGKRALDDPRNAYLLDFLRLVRELKPLAVLMENVPLIVTSHKGAIIREIVDGFADLGYSCCADILIASDYGVPQLRKRAFILAYRGDMGVDPHLPERSHERIPMASSINGGDTRLRFEVDKEPYISVEEAIGDLPPLSAGKGDEVMFYECPHKSVYQAWARTNSVAIFNHRSRSHSPEYLKKISIIVEGGRNQDLPDAQRFSDNYYSQAYARLHRLGIAQTVTTSFGNPGSGRFMHYRDLRAITVREAARFQSFPDRFVFEGNHSTQMRHVGNAVPPLLAKAIGEQIVRDLAMAGAGGERSTRKRVAETPEQRSRIMRSVPGRDTSVELTLRKALWRAGLRGYRLHDPEVPGSPDLVYGKSRVAVFVDGCFWHGCEKCYREPKSNKEYWTMKVKRNRERDERVNLACKEAGWRVIRVWEHEVLKVPERSVIRVAKALERASRRRRSEE